VHVESSVENPEPDTPTVDPAAAETGLNTIGSDPVPTVKEPEVESYSGPPVTVTTYEPAATSATTKEPVYVPPEIEQVCEAIGVPDDEQDVSLVDKLEPEKSTVLPTPADDGLKVREVALLTVNVADAESPIGLPVAVIV